MFDPLRPTKYSKEICKKYFGRYADSRLAARLHQEDPAKYREVRASAMEHELIGAESYATQREVDDLPVNKNARPRVFTDVEVAARMEFGEDEVRALYSRGSDGNENNLSKIAAEQPERYERLRIAAKSYGLPVSERAPKIALKPTPPPANTFTLEDRLADTWHLPRGTRVTLAQFENYMKLNQEVRETASKAAVESVPVAEEVIQ